MVNVLDCSGIAMKHDIYKTHNQTITGSVEINEKETNEKDGLSESGESQNWQKSSKKSFLIGSYTGHPSIQRGLEDDLKTFILNFFDLDKTINSIDSLAFY